MHKSKPMLYSSDLIGRRAPGRAAWLACALMVAATLGACKKGDDGTPAPGPTNPPVGVVDDTAGFYVSPIVPDANYQYFMHTGVSVTDPCKIVQGETVTSKRDIMCYFDARELDLYEVPLKFQYNVPSTMCDYLRVSPYVFSVLPYDPNPDGAAIEINTDDSGNVTIVDDPSHVAKIAANELTCDVDYSLNGGPNCCEGTYKLTSTTTSGSAGPSDTKWGGKRSNCLIGPGMDTQEKNPDGTAKPTDYRVVNLGTNNTYSIASPLSKNLFTDLYIANFFSVSPPYTPPLAMTANGTQPFYEFSCLDAAEETIARIRLQIRSWDTLVGFAQKGTAYYTAGMEGVPFNDQYLHDRSVWKDVTVTMPYPANRLFIPNPIQSDAPLGTMPPLPDLPYPGGGV